MEQCLPAPPQTGPPFPRDPLNTMPGIHPQPVRWVRVIIWANVAVALVSLLSFTFGWRDVLREWMPLTWGGLARGWWWECFTYMWIHAQFEGMGILHIVCNMMTLSPFGRTIEGTLGSRAFLGIYLAGGLGGACGFILESAVRHWIAGQVIPGDWGIVGASGAVLGVVAAFCVLQPDARIGVLFLPFRIRAGRFMLGFGIASAVMMFIPYLQIVAHSGHIGGMLGGWVWMKWVVGNRRVRNDSESRTAGLGDGTLALFDEVESLTPEALRWELEAVLEKSAQRGVEQLDERERLVLARARRLFGF